MSRRASHRNADEWWLAAALTYFARFLLTNLPLGSITVSAPARIITVASATRVGKPAPFENLAHERGYRPLDWRA